MSNVVQEEKELTEHEVRAYVAAAGLNSLARAYDQKSQMLLNSYISNNLSEIIQFWNLMDSNLKLKVVDANNHKILELLKRIS